MGHDVILTILLIASSFNLSESGLSKDEGLVIEPISGTKGYVEYYPGNMNLILTSPHGGSLKPKDISRRKGPGVDKAWQRVVLYNDVMTKEIAMGVAKHLEELTGRRPHLIVNNLDRTRLDPNVYEYAGTQGNKEAKIAYREYHDFITRARLAAAPTQLRVSSTGSSQTAQSKTMRMGDYYLSNKRYGNFPVYIMANSSQEVFVNKNSSQEVFVHEKLGYWVAGQIGGKYGLRNKESGGISPSPPVRGWQYFDITLPCKPPSWKCWTHDPNLLVESIAPPYVAVSSIGSAASRHPAMMGNYRLTEKKNNNHPVYKKEDNSQFIFVNEENAWVVFHTLDAKEASLRNEAGLTATPPRDGWKFWDKDSQSWKDDSQLRVDPPYALLLDFHGHVHGGNKTEIGYGLNSAQLNEDCKNCKAEKTYIRGLIQRTGINLLQMLHGSQSLGALFNDDGYKALPSPNQQKPGDQKYFNGGFTVTKHGSKEGGQVDAIQMEFPGTLRRPKPKSVAKVIRDRFILSLAHMIQRFYIQFYDNEDVSY